MVDLRHQKLSLKLVSIPDIGIDDIFDHRQDVFLDIFSLETHFGHSLADVSIDPFDAGHNVVMVGSFHFVEQEFFLLV